MKLHTSKIIHTRNASQYTNKHKRVQHKLLLGSNRHDTAIKLLIKPVLILAKIKHKIKRSYKR